MQNKIVYIKVGELIHKLEVSIDYETLKQLKKEIILNCSNTRRIEKQKCSKKDYSPEVNDYINDDHKYNIEIDNIERNYNRNDELFYDFDISYNLYDYPLIVDQITAVLNDKYNTTKDKWFGISFEEMIEEDETKKIIDEIDSILISENIPAYEKKEKIFELADKLKKYNKKQIGVINYYDSIIKCFNIENISSIKENDFRIYCDFICDNSSLDKIVSINELDDISREYLLEKIEKVPVRIKKNIGNN